MPESWARIAILKRLVQLDRASKSKRKIVSTITGTLTKERPRRAGAPTYALMIEGDAARSAPIAGNWVFLQA
jgi:hypothetical protein